MKTMKKTCFIAAIYALFYIRMRIKASWVRYYVWKEYWLWIKYYIKFIFLNKSLCKTKICIHLIILLLKTFRKDEKMESIFKLVVQYVKKFKCLLGFLVLV